MLKDITIQNVFLELPLLPFRSLRSEKFLSFHLGKSLFTPATERNITECNLWNEVNNITNMVVEDRQSVVSFSLFLTWNWCLSSTELVSLRKKGICLDAKNYPPLPKIPLQSSSLKPVMEGVEPHFHLFI